MAVKLSQLGEASVIALLSRLGFGTAKQSLLRYVQAGDGGDLSLAYDRAIAAGARTLRLPEGSYTWSAPKNYVSGLKFVGDEEIKTGGVGGTKINAPNGFLKNDNTTRKQLIIKNLHIIGNGTAASVGIDGPFGGLIQGCKIQGYDDCIRNLSGYLCTYRRISFDEALRGLNTADANGTLVEDCHFDASVLTQLTSRDGTPQTGTAAGLPFVIHRNNFNMGDDTLFAIKTRGQLEITSNYMEDFSVGVGDKTFIDIEVNRFDLMGGVIENNVINGQGNGATAIYFNGTHSGLNNKWNGYVRNNYVLGCAHDFVYGPNNRIPGLKIVNHESLVVENSYRLQHVDESEAWTYAILGTDFTTTNATATAVSDLSFVPEADAVYEIEGQFMVRTATATTGPRPGIAWPTGMSDGVGALQMSGGTGFAATIPRYGDISAPIALLTTDVANNTGSFPCQMKATLVSGATPSGSFQITLETEIAGTVATMRTGSWIKYRRIS